MPDMAQFHFLRPLWLTALLPAVLLYVTVRWRDDASRPWKGIIAPHLLSHLLVGRDRAFRYRPIHLIVTLLIFGSVALAGPTWEREVTPFTEDKAPLVVVLDVSLSMNAIDVQPTRLERAKHKIRDLFELRSGARTGLVAYAGSAHMVMPLTDDASILEMYLMALQTELMPVQGKDASRALSLAQQLLDREDVPGSILLVTDGIAADSLPAFVEHGETNQDALLILGVGTSEGGPVRQGDGFATDSSGRRVTAKLDKEGLEALSREANAFVATVTLDDRDVERIQRRVQSHLEAVREEDESARWRDFGYYLVFPVAVLGLLWFRKGWTVQWA
jgi:Ca-activated chloride channel family protein